MYIILRFLHFILTRTCFQFNNKFYNKYQARQWEPNVHQVMRLFLSYKIKGTFLQQQDKQPLIWWHFIHDTFMIWPHHREDLDSFIIAIYDRDKRGKSQLLRQSLNIGVVYTKPTDAQVPTLLFVSSDAPNM